MTSFINTNRRTNATAIESTHSPEKPTAPRPHASAFRWSWKLVTVAGIDVYVHATFLLLIVFVAFSGLATGQGVAAISRGTLLILAVFTTVVLHEFGHSLMARRFGVNTRDITLLPIGSVARLEKMPDKPGQQLLVALSGPAVNLFIALLLFGLVRVLDAPVGFASVLRAGGSFFTQLMWINLALGLFNLLPVYPMDGRRSLRALLAMRMAPERATQTAIRISQGVAVLFGLVGLLVSPLLTAIFILVWLGAYQAEHSVSTIKMALAGLPVRRWTNGVFARAADLLKGPGEWGKNPSEQRVMGDEFDAANPSEINSVWCTVAPLPLSLLRASVDKGARKLRSHKHNVLKAAVIGVTEVGERIAFNLKSRPWIGVEFVGFFDDRDRVRLSTFDQTLGRLCGTFDSLLEKAHDGEIDLVYIALPVQAEFRINGLIKRLSDTTASVYLAYELGGLIAIKARWKTRGGLQLLTIFENPFYGVNGWLKRLEDVVVGSGVLTFIAVPMLLIAIAIKFTSPGSVLFRQRRYGLNGRQIEVLKFRTMTTSDDGDCVQQACKDDPRITKIGSFLRRTSLDELPQFFQVITGQMSIVGPRPHAVAHNELYRLLINGYMLRHKVKPGITGWAQVNGWRGETNTLDKMQKRVEYDLNYIRHWALIFDLKIIFMTIFVVAGRKNAY
jgi:putative colanic acid biosysnthesis UDP-glucose lipid carrier transferase